MITGLSPSSPSRTEKLSVGESPAQPSLNLELEGFIRRRLQLESRDLYAEAHGQLDQFLLTCVLDQTGSCQYQAARLLGIARQTLRQKLRDMGLRVAPSIEAVDNGKV